MLDAAADAFDVLERRLGSYPHRTFRVAQSAGGYGMESPGLIWIPTGVARVEPALPRHARDRPSVVLRDRRQRPGEGAVRRRGRRRFRGAVRAGPASREPLRDGHARPDDLLVLAPRATTRRSTSRAATCSTTRGDGWARPRSGRRSAGTWPPTPGGSRRRGRCSRRSTPARRSTSAGRCSGRGSRRSTDAGRRRGADGHASLPDSHAGERWATAGLRTSRPRRSTVSVGGAEAVGIRLVWAAQSGLGAETVGI